MTDGMHIFLGMGRERKGSRNLKSVPQILPGLVILFGFNRGINTKTLNHYLGLSDLH